MRRAAEDSNPTAAPAQPRPAPTTMPALAARVVHLEELLEGLQDSVHRETERQGRRIADLEARLEPSALAVALSRDSRERGL